MAIEPAAAAAWATHESDVNGGDELTADAAAVDPTRVRPGGIDVVTPGYGPNEGTFAFVRPGRRRRTAVPRRGARARRQPGGRRAVQAGCAGGLRQQPRAGGVPGGRGLRARGRRHAVPDLPGTSPPSCVGCPRRTCSRCSTARGTPVGPEPAGDGATVAPCRCRRRSPPRPCTPSGGPWGGPWTTRAVAMALIGDGGTSEGDFARPELRRGLPGARRVPGPEQPVGHLGADRGADLLADHRAQGRRAAGIPGLRCDGQDALAVHATISAAVAHAHVGGGPVLVEALTYRFGPHTNNDDPSRYRAADAADAWKDRDPVAVLEQLAADRGLLSDDLRLDAQDRAAAARAEMRRALFGGADVDPMAVFDHVTSTTPAIRPAGAQLRRELAGRATRGDGGEVAVRHPRAGDQHRPRRRHGRRHRVLVFGEDVGKLGGVFRVTDGLQAKHGDGAASTRRWPSPDRRHGHRARRRPGWRPVPEMQFDGFTYPAFEQIVSHLAKLHNRTRGALRLPSPSASRSAAASVRSSTTRSRPRPTGSTRPV